MKAYTECQQFFKQQAGLGKSDEYRTNDQNIDYESNNIDDDVCKIVLYSKQSFQGNNQVFVESTKRIKAMERSLRTIGPCCWRIVR